MREQVLSVDLCILCGTLWCIVGRDSWSHRAAGPLGRQESGDQVLFKVSCN